MDWSLFGKPTFSDWMYTGAFADTWERGGFEKSELLGDSSEDVPSAEVEEWAGIELSPSAARLGEMQGVLIPAGKCAFGSRTGWEQFAGLPCRHPRVERRRAADGRGQDAFRTYLQEDAVASRVVLENVSDLSTFICFAASSRSTFGSPCFCRVSGRGRCVVSGHVVCLYSLSAALLIFCKAQRKPEREGDAERRAKHTSPAP